MISIDDTQETVRPSIQSGRGPGIVALDAFSVTVFAVSLGVIATHLAQARYDAATTARVGLMIVLGYLAADVASGLVHWFCDSFFAEDTPLIGPVVIRPFREHHRDPRAMTRHGFLETNGNNCLALLILLVPLALRGAPGTPPDAAASPVPWLELRWGAVSFALATFATNQLHKWAHLPSPRPRWIERLHATRLVLTPARHARHHRPPHEVGYCVTVGWMNPLVDRIAALVRARRRTRPEHTRPA